jgi:hypothetical protein
MTYLNTKFRVRKYNHSFGCGRPTVREWSVQGSFSAAGALEAGGGGPQCKVIHSWFAAMKNRVIIVRVCVCVCVCVRARVCVRNINVFYFFYYILRVLHLPGVESREYGRKDPSRWPRGTL